MRTEDGVSAVVGGILIMTIVLISITIILLSGGPLVEETNARANFVQAAQSFGQLKATASQLATNPQSAAATWRMPAIPGSLNLESRGDRVLVVASNSTTVRLSILAWENSDDWVVVHVDSLLPPTQFSVRAWSLSGGVTELSTKRHASFPEGGTGPGIGACGALAPEAGCLDAGGSTNHTVCDGANLDASTPALQTSGNATLLCLASASGKFNMTNLALRLEFLNASVPVATAWIVDAGSFHYQLSSTQARDIWFSAGNVYRREGDARYLDGGLSIPPSAPAGEGRAHAIQLVRLEGASSLSGLGTYTLTNVGRTALADFANVSSVSLAVSGPGRVPVMAGLVDATSGYDFGYEGREIEGWPAYEASRKGSLLPYSFRLFFARIHVES